MEDRSWMYKMYVPGVKGLTTEFVTGVNHFVDWALSKSETSAVDQIRCPCARCKNKKFQSAEYVKVHLYRKGFVQNYYNWTCHGEEFIPTPYMSSSSKIGDKSRSNNRYRDSTSSAQPPMQDVGGSHFLTPPPSEVLPLLVPRAYPSAGIELEHRQEAQPSTSIPTQTSTPPAPPSTSSYNAEVQDKRIYIEPYGETFTDQSQCASDIAEIFKARFFKSYATFSQVPSEVKDQWFVEFGDPIHNAQIRKAWASRCAKLLSDSLCRVRKAYKKRPAWISEEVYEQLCQYWQTEKFQKISKSARENRLNSRDGLGASLHTGGPISFLEHKLQRKERGEQFQYMECWERCHMFQDGPKKGQFVDQRSHQAYEDFLAIKDCYSQLESSGSVESIPDQKAMFIEADGGFKKGRVYGVGSESAPIKLEYSQTSCAESWSRPLEESLRMVEEKLRAEFDKKMQKKDRKIEQLMKINRKVMQYLGIEIPMVAESDDDDDDEDPALGPSA